MTTMLHAKSQSGSARLHALDCQHGFVELQIPEEKSKDGSWVQKDSKPLLALSHQQVRKQNCTGGSGECSTLGFCSSARGAS
jgi:hypothetical protein